MAASASEILANVSPYLGRDPRTLQLVTIGLLKQILLNLNPNAMTDVNTLLADSACLSCLTPSQLAVVTVSLLQSIVTNGSPQGTVGHGDPTSTPTSEPAYYIDLDTGTLWWYFNGVWQ